MSIYYNFAPDLKHIWQDLLVQLKQATSNPTNPLRTLSLATRGSQGTDVRMVILRNFDVSLLHCTFYTDSRAKKNIHIQTEPYVTLLAYDATIRRQIRLYGIAKACDQHTRTQQWNQLTSQSKTLYATQSNPGSIHTSRIKANQLLDLDDAQDNFMSYRIYIHKIEDLQLISSPIQRTAFHINRVAHTHAIESIQGQYLTP